MPSRSGGCEAFERGRAGLTQQCRYETLDVTIEDLIADTDRVAARLRWRGKRTSGEPVERESLEIIRVVDGRAIEHWGGRS